YFNLDFGNYDFANVKISRKIPICLVLDNSGSMGGEKILELNNNIRKFLDYIRSNPKAKRICDLCIISFGNIVSVVNGYDSIDNITFNDLKAYGGTPLGAAVEKAEELLDLRREYYKKNSIEHYKPIMMLMSDGEPTDDYEEEAEHFSKRVKNKELKIFPVGIGYNFNLSILKEFSPILTPKIIKDAAGFARLFELLSSSSSNPDDDGLEKWFNDEF
ncbi:MAG: VWA domain-containing protein, partial [Clostridia bacterium]